MCIFAKEVDSVSKTKIFTRWSTIHQQLLVYQMLVDLKRPNAMILPIPFTSGQALAWVNLSGYPKFFDDMAEGFPRAISRGISFKSTGAKSIAVEKVGSFDASIAASPADLQRLDPMFQLPEKVLASLTQQYPGWGFAVFKLRAGEQNIHPMGMTFTSREPRLFFPTLHVHDGVVHDKASFDHALYTQTNFYTPGEMRQRGWDVSTEAAGKFLDPNKVGGLFSPRDQVYRTFMVGEHANKDHWLTPTI